MKNPLFIEINQKRRKKILREQFPDEIEIELDVLIHKNQTHVYQ